MNLNDIVRLWHETQMGSMKRCNKAQEEFAEMMWELHKDMQPEIFDADKDCQQYHEEQDNKATKEK